MRTPARGYAARQRWFRPNWTVIALVSVLLVAGVLWATGIVDLTRLGLRRQEASTAGMVPVPVPVATIPTYTKITRDHLWNPRTGSLSVMYLRPQDLTPDMLRNAGQIIGRVLDHDKPAGYVFTETDFLPRGTRPGLVGGIPPGKRAMRVEADRIKGLFGLRPGDRFDLVSTLTIDTPRGSPMPGAGPYSQQLELQARMSNWQKQATVRVLVQSGQIVEPVTTRQIPVASSSLTAGLIIRNRPIQEVVIAVDPEEVAHLTEAIAVGAELSCIPRSGRPDDPEDSVTPDLRPWNPFGGGVLSPPSANPQPDRTSSGAPQNSFGAGPLTTIESISGTKREMVATPVKR